MCDFTCTDMEHMSGLLALGTMCQGSISRYSQGQVCRASAAAPDAAVFALLESAPVSLDVLLGFLVITPFMGLQEDFTLEKQDAFCDCRATADFNDWKLTPDQDTKDYITAMKGPLMILFNISTVYQNTVARLDAAFFYRIQQHVLFSKLVHRLFRLAAREIQGTPDGLALGVWARTIFVNMSSLDNQMDPIMYSMITQDTNPVWAHDDAEAKLLDKHDVTTFEELHNFLHELLPMDIVNRARMSIMRTRLRYNY
jgi:hypothetical protein